MASVATRDSVGQYERHYNALLRAIRPGGFLFEVEPHGPCEALIVPRQLALHTHYLVPYLLLPGQAPSGSAPVSPPPAYTSGDYSPLYDLGTGSGKSSAASFQAVDDHHRRHDDGNDSLSDGEFDSCTSRHAEHTRAIRAELRSITSDQRRRLHAVLATFLQYHTVHFDVSGSTHFRTGKGHSGEFDNTLTSVSRFGHRGSPQVVCDIVPLYVSNGTAVADPPGSPGVINAGGERPPTWAHSRAHTTVTAGRLPLHHPATLQLFIVDQPLMDPAELRALAYEIADIFAAHACLHGPEPGRDPSRQSTLQFDDVAVEDDRMPYVSVVPRANGPAVLSHHDGADDEGEDVTVEDDRSSYAPWRDAEANERNHHNPHHEDPSTTVGTSAPAPSDSASRTTALPSPAPPSPEPAHANVVAHHYSKQSIADYRRVVAADNEIGYGEFERLMGTPACLPLARLVPGFISAAQARGKCFRDNHSYLLFVDAVRVEVAQCSAVGGVPSRETVLCEGVEKYVTSRLYFMFFNVDEQERQLNQLLQDKFARVAGRLTAVQLDALEEVERHHAWGQAMFELDGMNFFKVPREKLRCGMRACELVSLAVGDILRSRAAAKANKANKDKAPDRAAVASFPERQPPIVAFGADEFLPCFVLLVLRAQPYYFYQNLQYIDKFRAEDLRSPEESYCLTIMMSAAQFWLNCNDSGALESSVKRPPPAATSVAAAAVAAAPVRPSAPSTATPCSIGSRLGPGSGSRTAGVVTGKAVVSACRGGGSAGTVFKGTVVEAPRLPTMREEDLLPSVRQASRMKFANRSSVPKRLTEPERHEAPAAGGQKDPVASTGQPVVAPPVAAKTDTVMDGLFGWAMPKAPPSAAGATTTTDAAAAGLPPADPTPRPAAAGGATTTHPVAYTLLVTEGKRFEALSERELRAIVEEARVLANTGAPGPI